MNPAVVFTGFAVGFLTGLTSVGGAALMAPLLVLVLGVRPVVAVGTDLAYGAITRLFGTWMHRRYGTVNRRIAGKLALGSLPGSLVGVLWILYLRRSGLNPDVYVRQAIGIVLVVAAITLLVQTLGVFDLRRLSGPSPQVKNLGTVGWGAVVGFSVGLTSIGSGSLILPFLILIHGLKPAQAVGTDLLHAFILMSFTAAAHSMMGTVDWPMVMALSMGSVPGVLLGSYLSPRLPTRILQAGLTLVLLTSGIKLV